MLFYYQMQIMYIYIYIYIYVTVNLCNLRSILCNHWGHILHHIATGHGGVIAWLKRLIVIRHHNYQSHWAPKVPLWGVLKEKEKVSDKGSFCKANSHQRVVFTWPGGSHWHAVHGTIQQQLDYGVPGVQDHLT